MKARDNPFATSRVLGVRYQLQTVPWDALEARLAKLHHRAAIVGPHGSGKTTFLEDLAARLATRGWRLHWLRLSEEFPKISKRYWGHLLPALGPRDFLMLDGAEQLSRLSWFMLKRRCRHVGGLVVTAHRPGWLPTLHSCVTHPELLASIAGTLMGRPAGLPDHDARDLFARHHGNLREALRELYDRCARLPSFETRPS